MPAQVIFPGQNEPLIVPDYETARGVVVQAFPEAYFGPCKAQASCVIQRAWNSMLDAIAELPCVAHLRRTINDTERKAQAAAIHLERFGQSRGVHPKSVIHEFYECWWEPTSSGASIIDCDGNLLLELCDESKICESLADAERRVCSLFGLGDAWSRAICDLESFLALAEKERGASHQCIFTTSKR